MSNLENIKVNNTEINYQLSQFYFLALISKYFKKVYSFFGDYIEVRFLQSNNNTVRFIVNGPLGNVTRIYSSKTTYSKKNILKYINTTTIIIHKNWLSLLLKDFEKILIGLTKGWSIGLEITGRGFNFKLITRNDKLFLRVKIGYSHFIFYDLSSDIFINLSVKKTKLIIFGLNF